MKIVAIIQARMGSTRLPHKVMLPLGGKPALYHVVERVGSCSLIDEVVVATTELEEDDIIQRESIKFGARTFRGNEKNVLDRYYHAAKDAKADIIVRITSDCPLVDPLVLKDMLEMFLTENASQQGIDYLSNSLERTFPRGLDAEIFSFNALTEAFTNADKTYELEHVTPYIYEHPKKFKLKNFYNITDKSSHRWTLDTIEDYIFLKKIFDILYTGKIFSTEAVFSLLKKQPQLMKINAHIEQKEITN